jgi:hypothetical protein
MAESSKDLVSFTSTDNERVFNLSRELIQERGGEYLQRIIDPDFTMKVKNDLDQYVLDTPTSQLALLFEFIEKQDIPFNDESSDVLAMFDYFGININNSSWYRKCKLREVAAISQKTSNDAFVALADCIMDLLISRMHGSNRLALWDDSFECKATVRSCGSADPKLIINLLCGVATISRYLSSPPLHQIITDYDDSISCKLIRVLQARYGSNQLKFIKQSSEYCVKFQIVVTLQ